MRRRLLLLALLPALVGQQAVNQPVVSPTRQAGIYHVAVGGQWFPPLPHAHATAPSGYFGAGSPGVDPEAVDLSVCLDLRPERSTEGLYVVPGFEFPDPADPEFGRALEQDSQLSMGPEHEVLRALVLPAEGEDPWAELPWRTSLWQARLDAAAAQKPILLWEMDGHPLGCT